MKLSQLAIPTVSLLISFLSCGSQLLFHYIAPSPLTSSQSIKFNIFVACIWISYFRACFTDPGRVPEDYTPPALSKSITKDRDHDDTYAAAADDNGDQGGMGKHKRGRWCRKCEAHKPPRAHHCKVCERCIPKMDHHCPWTVNCVSHRTFPHFFRFLFYAVVAMMYLEYLLYLRVEVLWQERHFSSYLGPSAPQLILLFLLTITNSITLFALSILLAKNIYTVGANVTTIEGWEIERHSTVVRRARVFGGYLDGPDGQKVYIKRQEFPYDIGILANVHQALGSYWPWVWLWVFAASPTNVSGLVFEVNGFEDPSLPWPPPDPDRIPRRWHQQQLRPQIAPLNDDSNREEADTLLASKGDDYISAFHARQAADFARQDRHQHHHQHHPKQQQQQQQRRNNKTAVITGIIRRKPFRQRYKNDDNKNKSSNAKSVAASVDASLLEEEVNDNGGGKEEEGGGGGEESWRNTSGENLADFGVDEEVEFYDDDYHDHHEGVDGDGGGSGYDGVDNVNEYTDDENEDVDRTAADDDGNDDDVPLGELIRRRRIKKGEESR